MMFTMKRLKGDISYLRKGASVIDSGLAACCEYLFLFVLCSGACGG